MKYICENFVAQIGVYAMRQHERGGGCDSKRPPSTALYGKPTACWLILLACHERLEPNSLRDCGPAYIQWSVTTDGTPYYWTVFDSPLASSTNKQIKRVFVQLITRTAYPGTYRYSIGRCGWVRPDTIQLQSPRFKDIQSDQQYHVRYSEPTRLGNCTAVMFSLKWYIASKNKVIELTWLHIADNVQIRGIFFKWSPHEIVHFKDPCDRNASWNLIADYTAEDVLLQVVWEEC